MPIRKYKTEKQKKKAVNKQQNQYRKRAYYSFNVKFHKVHNALVIEKLKEVENRTEYIRMLIEKDIENGEE